MEYSGRVAFFEIDISDHYRAAAEYGIMGIPAIRMFKGGKVVGGLDGAASKQRFDTLIQQAMS